MFTSVAYSYPADIPLLTAQLSGQVVQHGKQFLGEIVSISLRGLSNQPGDPPLAMILEVVWALRAPPVKQIVTFPMYQPEWDLEDPLKPVAQAQSVTTAFPTGYYPSLITAVSNPFGTTQFAVVWEDFTLSYGAAVQASKKFPFLVYGLPLSADVGPADPVRVTKVTTFESICQTMNGRGYVARSIASYIQVETIVFAVTFWPAGYSHTPDFTGWSVDACASADLQARLTAFHTTSPWPPRPEMIAVTRLPIENGPSIDVHGVLWHDNLLRPDAAWEVAWGVDEATFNLTYRQGVTVNGDKLWPIRVQAGGEPPNVIYNVVLAGDDRAQPRVAFPPEYAHPASDGVDYFATLDAGMFALMRLQGTRGAQLSIAIDDRLVCAKAYTWAEASYPAVTVEKRFRIGSNSKVLTALTTLWVLEQRTDLWADLETALYDQIENKWPAAVPSPCPYLKTVTVAGLTTHSAGLDTPDIEPTNSPLVFTIQEDRRSLTGPYMQGPIPITRAEATADALAFASLVSPTQGFFSYSNQSPMMLGYYIESIQGRSYELLVTEMLGDLGLVLNSDTENVDNGGVNQADVYFHDLYPTLITSVIDPSRPLTSIVYGGFDFSLFRAAGGWMMKTHDLVMVLGGLWGSLKGKQRKLPLGGTAASLALTPNLMQRFPFPTVKPGEVAYSFGGLQVGNLIRGNGGELRYFKNGDFYGCASLLATREDGVSVAMNLNQKTWGFTLGDPQFILILAKFDAALKALPKDYDLFAVLNP